MAITDNHLHVSGMTLLGNPGTMWLVRLIPSRRTKLSSKLDVYFGMLYYRVYVIRAWTYVAIGQDTVCNYGPQWRDGCFVCIVYSRWIRVALENSCRCGRSRQYWWRTLRWHERVVSLSRVLQESRRIYIYIYCCKVLLCDTSGEYLKIWYKSNIVIRILY